MARIEVAVEIDAPPAEVWAAVEDVGTHVRWMADAVAIRFTSEQRAGTGTRFDCDTKVGPFRLTDRMRITEWVDGSVMGVRHEGLVTGEGRFTLAPASRPRTTRFTWAERLVFPWWMAGPVGATVAAPVLRHIWRRNLDGLKQLVERG